MVSKFLSKYYSYSKALQLRKDILNFQQLPTDTVFEAWERFKSCLQKCPDHRNLLVHQILAFYHGIIMIDRDKIMVAVGGNIMRKTPQEAYYLIENMTQHHYQWDSEVQYDTTIDMIAHYSKTTFTSREQVEVLGNDTEYTIQSVQHQPGPGHPNTFHYTYSDESDEDEPSEVLKVQKSIHPLSGSPTPSSDSIVASPFPSLTLLGNSDFLLEETTSPPQELDNDSEGDILFIEKLLKDKHEDIDDIVLIPRVSEKPLDSFDPISKTFDMTITNPLFDFDSEFTLNSGDPIFDIHNEESDESETETIMEEIPSDESKVHIEDLSMLWGNRLPIPDGLLPLSG
ncbi:reverse transcriptase domain-containing protein [Tanacetum coccineum]